MPKTRNKKEELLKEYVEKFDGQKSVVIANFTRLTVKDVEELRKKCREKNVKYEVIKKTLLERALKEKGISFEDKKIAGLENNIGVAFGKDEVGPAKVFFEYSKDHAENFNVAAGILENKFIESNEVKALASMPSKEELLAKVVGSIKAPVSNFVNVLQGNLRGLVQVLNAIKDNK